jgi:hypothetical protein
MNRRATLKLGEKCMFENDDTIYEISFIPKSNGWVMVRKNKFDKSFKASLKDLRFNVSR